MNKMITVFQVYPYFFAVGFLVAVTTKGCMLEENNKNTVTPPTLSSKKDYGPWQRQQSQ